MADDSTKKYLEQLMKENANSSLKGFRHLDSTDIVDMADKLGPADELLAKEASSAKELAGDIKSRISKRALEDTKKVRGDEFLKKYGSKMQAGAGMDLQSIPDETARIGMKNPLQRASKLDILKKLAKKSAGPVLGAAGLLMQEDLNPVGNPIEDPSIPAEIRARLSQEMSNKSRREPASMSRSMPVDVDLIERAKQVGDRIENDYYKDKTPMELEGLATDKAMKEISPQEQMKILKQLRDANRRK